MSRLRTAADAIGRRWREVTPETRAVALAVGLLVASVFIKAFVARVLMLERPGTLLGIASDMLAATLFLAPGLLLWRSRRGRVLLLALATLLSVVLLASMVYLRYFDDVVSLGAIRMFTSANANGENVLDLLDGNLQIINQYYSGVGGSVLDLLIPVDALFLVDLPLVGWLLLRRPSLGKPRRSPVRLRAGLVAIGIGFVALVTGIALVSQSSGILGSKTTSRRYGLFAYQVASYFYDSDLDLDWPVDPADPADVGSSIDRLRGAPNGSRATSVAHGEAAGQNVIIIQAEALQTMLIGAEIDGVELTPNLNALVEESWYFPHTYSQLGGGGTSDAEFISNTSLYPPAVEPASIRWADREIPSLPRVLEDAGYATMTFHTNDVDFWNREDLYAALGFGAYYDRDYFGDEDIIGFGASDDVLYAGTLPVLLDLQASGTPFYAQIVSVTAHHPFHGMPEGRVDLALPEEYDDTQLGAYVTYQSFADRALGEFIGELKRTGLWDESIVIVYGDHMGISDLDPDERDAAVLSALLGRDYTIVDRLNVPLVVHLPGQTEGEVDESASAVMDVMPTVLDLLGIETSTPMFGRSVFAGGPTNIAMRRYVEAGAYVRNGALVVPGDHADEATALPIDDPGSPREATRGEIAGLAKAVDLILLSDAWTDSLPAREEPPAP